MLRALLYYCSILVQLLFANEQNCNAENVIRGFLYRMEIAVQNTAQVLQIVKMVTENQGLMVAFGLLNKLPGVLNLNRYGVPEF